MKTKKEIDEFDYLIRLVKRLRKLKTYFEARYNTLLLNCLLLTTQHVFELAITKEFLRLHRVILKKLDDDIQKVNLRIKNTKNIDDDVLFERTHEKLVHVFLIMLKIYFDFSAYKQKL